jgi:hypothetical protein
MKDKAKEILESYYPYWKNSSQQDSIIKAMIEFSFNMCELQKIECANSGYQCGNQSGVEIEQYILNCKNVCEL